MFSRFLQSKIAEALTDTPVVFVNGPRQSGKTTLVRQLADAARSRYANLDDAFTLSQARSDPASFIESSGDLVVLDEVQHAPELFRAIKVAVDRNRRPGRYLLTGSANTLHLPRISESLAGRIEIQTLWPLAQAEIDGRDISFVDRLFLDAFPPRNFAPCTRQDLARRITVGGFPESVMRKDKSRREAWFTAYVNTILQRDVRDYADIEGLAALPRLLRLLAARPSGLVNLAAVARDAEMPRSTLARYTSLLQATFLVQLVQPWFRNLGLRIVKSPKLILCDTGLSCDLLNIGEEALLSGHLLMGGLLESFVTLELLKHLGWSSTRAELLHFRTHDRQEVDLVLEDRSGRIVGLEVKAGAPRANDAAGLHALAAAAGSSFVRGVILYIGDQVIPFGDKLHAVPVSALWSASS